MSTSPRYALRSRVQGRYGGGAIWYPGAVAKLHSTDSNEWRYDIQYDDGDFEAMVSESLLRDDPESGSSTNAEEDDAPESHTGTQASPDNSDTTHVAELDTPDQVTERNAEMPSDLAVASESLDNCENETADIASNAPKQSGETLDSADSISGTATEHDVNGSDGAEADSNDVSVSPRIYDSDASNASETDVSDVRSAVSGNQELTPAAPASGDSNDDTRTSPRASAEEPHSVELESSFGGMSTRSESDLWPTTPGDTSPRSAVHMESPSPRVPEKDDQVEVLCHGEEPWVRATVLRVRPNGSFDIDLGEGRMERAVARRHVRFPLEQQQPSPQEEAPPLLSPPASGLPSSDAAMCDDATSPSSKASPSIVRNEDDCRLPTGPSEEEETSDNTQVAKNDCGVTEEEHNKKAEAGEQASSSSSTPRENERNVEDDLADSTDTNGDDMQAAEEPSSTMMETTSASVRNGSTLDAHDAGALGEAPESGKDLNAAEAATQLPNATDNSPDTPDAAETTTASSPAQTKQSESAQREAYKHALAAVSSEAAPDDNDSRSDRESASPSEATTEKPTPTPPPRERQAASVHPRDITATRKALHRLINWPALTDKLLSRPPFRFIHDVVMQIINCTGFGVGLFTSDEVDARAVRERGDKVVWLEKIIALVELSLNRPLPHIKPRKIAAGKETSYTLFFLRMLAHAALRHGSHPVLDPSLWGGQHVDAAQTHPALITDEHQGHAAAALTTPQPALPPPPPPPPLANQETSSKAPSSTQEQQQQHEQQHNDDDDDDTQSQPSPSANAALPSRQVHPLPNVVASQASQEAVQRVLRGERQRKYRSSAAAIGRDRPNPRGRRRTVHPVTRPPPEATKVFLQQQQQHTAPSPFLNPAQTLRNVPESSRVSFRSRAAKVRVGLLPVHVDATNAFNQQAIVFEHLNRPPTCATQPNGLAGVPPEAMLVSYHIRAEAAMMYQRFTLADSDGMEGDVEAQGKAPSGREDEQQGRRRSAQTLENGKVPYDRDLADALLSHVHHLHLFPLQPNGSALPSNKVAHADGRPGSAPPPHQPQQQQHISDTRFAVSFPADVFSNEYMPALTALSCTGFCLPSFPGKDTRLVALHRLTLSDNCIAELPARIDLVVPNVSELVLDRNCLMALPTGFSGLTPLRRLDLAHNNISELPTCLFSLPLLEHVDISFNRVTHLPKWFSPAFFACPAASTWASLLLEGNPLSAKERRVVSKANGNARLTAMLHRDLMSDLPRTPAPAHSHGASRVHAWVETNEEDDTPPPADTRDDAASAAATSDDDGDNTLDEGGCVSEAVAVRSECSQQVACREFAIDNATDHQASTREQLATDSQRGGELFEAGGQELDFDLAKSPSAPSDAVQNEVNSSATFDITPDREVAATGGGCDIDLIRPQSSESISIEVTPESQSPTSSTSPPASPVSQHSRSLYQADDSEDGHSVSEFRGPWSPPQQRTLAAASRCRREVVALARASRHTGGRLDLRGIRGVKFTAEECKLFSQVEEATVHVTQVLGKSRGGRDVTPLTSTMQLILSLQGLVILRVEASKVLRPARVPPSFGPPYLGSDTIDAASDPPVFLPDLHRIIGLGFHIVNCSLEKRGMQCKFVLLARAPKYK